MIGHLPKQMVMAGKLMFPCPSSPNLYATELAVFPDLYLIIAVILQYIKMLVKVSKLRNLNTKLEIWIICISLGHKQSLILGVGMLFSTEGITKCLN